MEKEPTEIKFPQGIHIEVASATACTLALLEDQPHCFDFNSISVVVQPGDMPDKIVADYRERIAAKRTKLTTVPGFRTGGDAAADLALITEELKECGPIQLADAEHWEKVCKINSSEQAAAIIHYAERWARVMQNRMAKGAKLEDVAESTSILANTEALGGEECSFAVHLLSKAWTSGEALRRWHNLRYQMQKEGEEANEHGGTLNVGSDRFAINQNN